jgi:hypothetical protein
VLAAAQHYDPASMSSSGRPHVNEADPAKDGKDEGREGENVNRQVLEQVTVCCVKICREQPLMILPRSCSFAAAAVRNSTSLSCSSNYVPDSPAKGHLLNDTRDTRGDKDDVD